MELTNPSNVLEKELLGCLVRWPPQEGPGRPTWFLPKSSLEELVTPQSISDSINGQYPNRVFDRELINQYHRQASKLFALFIIIGRSNSFVDFMDEQLTDMDLPFARLPGVTSRLDITLHPFNRPDRSIHAISGWPTRDIEQLESDQFTVLTPFFDKMDSHQDIIFPHTSTIFPFVRDDEMKSSTHTPAGAYGRVWKVCIHPAHHNFTDSSGRPLQDFAIKRLHSKDQEPFKEEGRMLRAFDNEMDIPFVHLCAAYTWKGEHHFLFSWADATLKQYWEKVQLPKFNRDSLLWTLKQCLELSYAIYCMHSYKSPQDYKAVGLSRRYVVQIPTIGPQNSGDQKDYVYAQHGDIKPSNILWERNTTDRYVNGRLIIADLGLSAFHKESSKYKLEITRGSNTFSPPECELGLMTSLRYDIWSLGGVFLSFITWISSGHEGLLEFDKRRKERDPRFPDAYFWQDQFFSLRGAEQSRYAVVNQGVISWIAELRHHRYRSCQMIHDFLDIIQKEMLLINSDERIRSSELLSKLHKMYEKSLHDETYLAPGDSAPRCMTCLPPSDGVDLPSDHYLFTEDR